MRSIRWGNQIFDLHADRAIHWRKTNALIIADPHFGKAAAFRAGGVPVPTGTTRANLDRLSKLLHQTVAQRLIVLGDFLHAAAGRADDTMNAIAGWRQRYPMLQIVLVRGNHDQHAGDPPCEWNFMCVDEPFVFNEFSFRHTPMAPDQPSTSFNFAGHIHPCVVLRSHTGASLRSACFHFTAHEAILPVFGAFTGTHPIRPRKGDRVFAVGDNCIQEVKTVRA